MFIAVVVQIVQCTLLLLCIMLYNVHYLSCIHCSTLSISILVGLCNVHCNCMHTTVQCPLQFFCSAVQCSLLLCTVLYSVHCYSCVHYPTLSIAIVCIVLYNVHCYSCVQYCIVSIAVVV